MLPTKDIAAIARESSGSDAALCLSYIQDDLAAHRFTELGNVELGD